MVVLVVKYYCKPGRGDEVQTYLREMKALVQENEIGCKAYTAHRSTENKDQFLLYERYADRNTFEAHRNTPYFSEIIQGRIYPLLEKTERELYNLID